MVFWCSKDIFHLVAKSVSDLCVYDIRYCRELKIIPFCCHFWMWLKEHFCAFTFWAIAAVLYIFFTRMVLYSQHRNSIINVCIICYDGCI